ncbi:MAG: metallophosphoesterase [Pyrinomonadaceae bacterium]
MRRIVHISDLHFGREDPAAVEGLVKKICELRPHLVVVSGDLTQRARSGQFRQARDFLDRLPVPQLVVPGNHDVPLYNVLDRFAQPLENFKRFISDDLSPIFADDEIAVAGVNTTRSLTIKGGRITRAGAAELRRKLDGIVGPQLKIVVTHHPFDTEEGLGRAPEAMAVFADCGADLFLSGHLHVSGVTSSTHQLELEAGRSVLLVAAGTAVSVRERGEANSFNVLDFDPPFLKIETHRAGPDAGGFNHCSIQRFERVKNGWAAV